MLRLSAMLLIIAALGLFMLRKPPRMVDGPRTIPTGPSAAAVRLEPEQVVRRVAAPWLSGTRRPWAYADDLTLIALADFGHAAGTPELLRPERAANAARLGKAEVASCSNEPFVSLSYERVRDEANPALAAAYVQETVRCTREAVRGSDGAVSFWRADRAVIEIDKRRHTLKRANAPMLLDNVQEFAVRLARSAALAKQPQLAHDATDQLAFAERALRDPATGLWAHARGWYGEPNSLVAVHWGRGQGWAMRGLVETLAVLPAQSPERLEVRAILLRLATALLRYQDSKGLWHQVVDEPDSYSETSASGMISGYLARAVHQGDLPTIPFALASRRAWQGLLASKIAADGTVYGGVRDTPPLPAVDSYRQRITPVNDPHAIAAVIIAATGQVLLARGLEDSVSQRYRAAPR